VSSGSMDDMVETAARAREVEFDVRDARARAGFESRREDESLTRTEDLLDVAAERPLGSRA
jgi:hypothetical protein